ncbi:MAG: quinone oxidoreductase family protein [Kineosporiaceae bacterium]
MTDVIPRTTLAAVLTRHGAPPRAADHPLPEPAAGQCLVTVTAAPVVPLDLLCASGTSYFGPPALPYVPGVQGIGVVAAGESLAPGTRVWFATDAGMRPGDGGLARHAVVDERETVTLPEGVGDAQAAALGLSGVAAWMSLTWRGRLQPGEAVLVLGAGGVVGQVAVQVAVALGAGRVVAASRRAVGRERARRGGAAAVVDLADADVGTLEARMLRATDGARVDLVIDPVCGDASTAALRRLADGGRLVNLGSSGGPTASFASAALRSGSQSILGYTNNALTRRQRAEALLNVLELAAAGRCTVDVEEYPLEDVAAAWTRAGAAPDGRVVVVPPTRAVIKE